MEDDIRLMTLLKPGISTSIRYRPGGRFGSEYSPATVVVASYRALVSTWIATIWAATTTALEASVTRPETEAFVDCARRTEPNDTTRRTATVRTVVTIHLLWPVPRTVDEHVALLARPHLGRSDCGDLIRCCQRHAKGFGPNGIRCHGAGRRRSGQCAAAASDRDQQGCRCHQHANLGPGIPDAPPGRLAQPNGHQIPAGHDVNAVPILSGSHHEYRLEPLAV
jgi:hypothetical protein